MAAPQQQNNDHIQKETLENSENNDLSHVPLTAESIGKILKMAREKRGQTIEDIGANIRINIDFLNHIENGRLEELPGKVYVLGFVRTYSNYLGLDENMVIASLKASPDFVNAKNKQEKVLITDVAAKPKSTSKLSIFISIMLLGLAVLGLTMFIEGDVESNALDNVLSQSKPIKLNKAKKTDSVLFESTPKNHPKEKISDRYLNQSARELKRALETAK